MVKVALSKYRGNLVHAVTNEFGEFRCEIDNSGDLELSVPGREIRRSPFRCATRSATRRKKKYEWRAAGRLFDVCRAVHKYYRQLALSIGKENTPVP